MSTVLSTLDQLPSHVSSAQTSNASITTPLAAPPSTTRPTINNAQPMQTHGKSDITIPKKLLNLNNTTSALSPIPKTYRTSLKNPNRYNSMLEEYNVLLHNITWPLILRPSSINVVTEKWIFQHKMNPMAPS